MLTEKIVPPVRKLMLSKQTLRRSVAEVSAGTKRPEVYSDNGCAFANTDDRCAFANCAAKVVLARRP